MVLRATAALLLVVLGAAGTAVAQPKIAAEIASLDGKGEHRQAQETGWRAARVQQPLFATEFVRTLDMSRMAIVFPDRTRLQLSQNSTLQIKGAESGTDARTILNLNSGRAWTTSKSAPRGVTVETPAARAAIRGTEWEIAVDGEGRATLSVFSGEVEFFNDQGLVVVGPSEQAVAERGKAPVKLALRVSRDRVQWVSSFTVDANRYGVRNELPGIAALIDEQRLAEAYARVKARVGPGAPASADLLLGDFEVYRGELAAADAALKQGRARYPDDERFDSALARVALYNDRPAEALALAQAAVARRPDSAEALVVLGDVERVLGRSREAIAAYSRATAIAAKDPRGWHGLGVVESERENVREARAHLEKARALDPKRSETLAELGTLEGFAGNLDRAREALKQAIAANPGNFVAWTGLGVVELRAGNEEAAGDALARASSIEPGYARARLYLAVVQYRLAGDVAALDELKRVSELDPQDPLPHFLASMVFIDRVEPGIAVAAAEQAMARLPFLRSLNPVATNQRGVANAGYPLAAIGLEAWARSNAQESYLPSWGGSHFFLADRYPGDFNRRSELVQGFITDPIAFGASNRFQGLFVQPGHYGTLALRTDTSDDQRTYEPVLTLNGNGIAPAPFAYFAEVGEQTTKPGNSPTDSKLRRFTGGFGVKPSHEWGAFLYVNHFKSDTQVGQVFLDESGTRSQLFDIAGRASRVDGGVSYAPSARARLWVKAGAGEGDSTTDFVNRLSVPGLVLDQGNRFAENPRGRDASVRYAYDWDDRLELSLGAQYASYDNPQSLAQDTVFHPPGAAVAQDSVVFDDRDRSRSVLAAARYRTPAFRIEGGVEWHEYTKDRANIVTLARTPGSPIRIDEAFRRDRVDPMLGIALPVTSAGIVRAACRRWVRPFAPDTLAPVAIAGVPLDDQLVLPGGESEQCRAQAEWRFGARSFALLSLEHVETNNIVLLGGVANVTPDPTNLDRLRNRINPQPTKPDELGDIPNYGGGVVRRASAAYERLLTPRVAARLYYTYTDSENNQPGLEGKKVPLLPRHQSTVGLTWTPGWHVQVTVQAIHRTQFYFNESNGIAFPASWEGQVFLFAETPDKRWSVEAKALNLFRKEISDVFGFVLSYRF